ncbi:hypothetical protein Cenrod_1101 [Candidatus Symbiobacter mobilis CR]|uniref:Uncharacterized protein n=1 Tax=Candidatus Symbiobacter mobilis CR TaxID=946483 RepID=U5NAH1_9BURK|nr:hypothetical protein Cenrod_1101 [Candidatus Symbiobacter mobilis CR]
MQHVLGQHVVEKRGGILSLAAQYPESRTPNDTVMHPKKPTNSLDCGFGGGLCVAPQCTASVSPWRDPAGASGIMIFAPHQGGERGAQR